MQNKSSITGREKEQERLNTICNSAKSEFVAVYGRRRVGKTFLIREFFSYSFSFQITGLANASTDQQLFNFHTSLTKQSGIAFLNKPTTWLQALQMLIAHLEQVNSNDKKVIFFDEMPWFDTKGSDFIMALEHFWNSWATNRKDIILIACGSAASWMVNNLINNTGGLHNRITQKIKIIPFTLLETETMLQRKDIVLNRYQLIQLYMTTGGIPYYLDAVQPGLSAGQNIQQLFFEKTGLLKNEFFNLYRSLFKKYDVYERTVEVLSAKKQGLLRSELAAQPGMTSGGTLTRILRDLEESGFITAYTDMHSKQKNTIYRLSDYYTSFYFTFIKNGKYKGEDVWTNLLDNPLHRTWQGFTFEQICIDHILPIKKALGISGILSNHAAWRGSTETASAQIDLLIDRRDDVINICEAKFCIDSFTITKDYAEKLRKKISLFKAVSKTRKSVFLTFITTYGVEKNQYAHQLVQNEVTMDDLFV